jgi:hypothetical protein
MTTIRRFKPVADIKPIAAQIVKTKIINLLLNY